MSGDQQKLFKLLAQATEHSHSSLRDFAWVFAGALLLIGIALMIGILCWINRGGLSRPVGRRFPSQNAAS